MEKERLITVKGIGAVTVPVDYVEIEFALRELNKNYEQGYGIFEQSCQELHDTILTCGFNKTDLKTSEVKVAPEYEKIRNNDSYVEVFQGYLFRAELKLRFNYNSQKIGELLNLVSKSKTKPKIHYKYNHKKQL